MNEKPKDPEEKLISETEAVDFFNKRTGADCETIEDTVRYLKEHPESRKLLEGKVQ